jgi:hypothetical protein
MFVTWSFHSFSGCPSGRARCEQTAQHAKQPRRCLAAQPAAPPHLAEDADNRGEDIAADERVHLLLGGRHADVAAGTCRESERDGDGARRWQRAGGPERARGGACDFDVAIEGVELQLRNRLVL